MESEIFQRFSKKNEIREYLILSEEKSFRIVNDCPTTYITHYQNLANFKLSPTNKPQLRLNNIKLLIWQRAIYKTVTKHIDKKREYRTTNTDNHISKYCLCSINTST